MHFLIQSLLELNKHFVLFFLQIFKVDIDPVEFIKFQILNNIIYKPVSFFRIIQDSVNHIAPPGPAAMSKGSAPAVGSRNARTEAAVIRGAVSDGTGAAWP